MGIIMAPPGTSPRGDLRTRGGSNASLFLHVVVEYSPTFMIFVAGIMIGMLYGSSSDVMVVYAPAVSSTTASLRATTTSSSFDTKNNDSNGWQTVHVFYGSNDHSVSLLPTSSSSSTNKEGQQEWYSQARQDEAVYTFLKKKRNGFFVDLAANDATTLSNTYILERDYGWNGLCIEPNPMYWYNLTHYRPNCKIVAAVVGETRMEQVHFLYQAGDHGGISGEGFDNGPKFKGKSMKEYTIPLLEIFQQFQVPKVIDYLSLDVEGAEEFIMKGFPLDDYQVRLLTIERPKEALRDVLESHGYQQLQRISRWGETLWTHKDVYSELELSRLDEFHGKNLYLAEKAREEEQEKAAQKA
jgi:hypothetical protein